MKTMRGFKSVFFLFCIVSSGFCQESEILNLIEELQDAWSNNTNVEYNGIQRLPKDPDIYLNITQLIRKNNYSVEVYEVVTSDGYVLKLFRIPGKGPAVLLMHGVICSADDWITGGVNSGLGYLLAQHGFDVWMGNVRGNKHSRSNIYVDPSKQEFWDFSFHEMGLIDAPTMVDFILEKTNRSSLIYIGHSQGTTLLFVMCSLRPEYNQKISLMIALSPVSWISHMKSPVVNTLKLFYGSLKLYAALYGINEVFGDTSVQRWFQRTFCGDMVWAYIICQHVIFLLGGFNYRETNYKSLPVIYNHFPAGSSFKQILHFGQLLYSADFRPFDYGVENIVKYGSISPPTYPVEKITAPVAIFYGEGDWLSDPIDARILKSRLPNLIDFYKVEDNNFSHFDFIYALHTKDLLLPNILRLIKKTGLRN